MWEQVRDHLQPDNHQQKLGAEQEGQRAPGAVVHVKSSWGEEKRRFTWQVETILVSCTERGGGGGVFMCTGTPSLIQLQVSGLCARAGGDAARRARLSGGRGVNVLVGGRRVPGETCSRGLRTRSSRLAPSGCSIIKTCL